MDKWTQLKILFSKAVPIPVCTDDFESARLWVDRGVITWGRKINHTQGRDIATNPASNKWRKCDYWVEVIQDVKDEWRIHVMDGLVIHCERKVHIDLMGAMGFSCRHRLQPNLCGECGAIRSHRNSWRMIRDRKPSLRLMKLAKNAVAALEWDLGAVDILEKSDGAGAVLEVNSRPGLDSRTARQYVKGIQRRIQR
jgi:hypothetical protein